LTTDVYVLLLRWSKKTVEEEHEKQKSDDTLHKKVSKGVVILNDSPPNKVPDIAPKPAVYWTRVKLSIFVDHRRLCTFVEVVELT
jgi:hypothetical protein